jgi:hypothetical protein
MAAYINQNAPEELRLAISKEAFMTIPLVIYCRKNFYLLDEINEKIEFLKASGLINFWHSQNIRKRFLTVNNLNLPKILNIKQLSGCFHIVLLGTFVSFVVFLLEYFSNKIIKPLFE